MSKKRSNGTGGLFQTRNGDGSLKSPVWYASYRKNGQRFCKSTGETVKAKAEAKLREWMTDSARGMTPVPETTSLTYDALRAALISNYRINGYKSLQVLSDGEETVFPLTALDDFFAGKKVSDITPDTVRAFIEKRQADRVGNAAINNSLALLRRMFSIAKHEGRIGVAPFIALLPKPPARQGFVDDENFEKLLAGLPDHLQPLVLFLYRCGGRVGEALELDWSQVNMKDATLTFRAEQTKTNEGRTVPLPDRLVNMLRAIKPKEGKVFSGENLRWSWNRACVAAGLGEFFPTGDLRHPRRYEGLNIHDLRRSALNNFRKAGVPHVVAMQFSGHKTMATFNRYNIVDPAEKRDAISKVEQRAATPITRKALLSRRSRHVGRLLGAARP